MCKCGMLPGVGKVENEFILDRFRFYRNVLCERRRYKKSVVQTHIEQF